MKSAYLYATIKQWEYSKGEFFSMNNIQKASMILTLATINDFDIIRYNVPKCHGKGFYILKSKEEQDEPYSEVFNFQTCEDMTEKIKGLLEYLEESGFIEPSASDLSTEGELTERCAEALTDLINNTENYDIETIINKTNTFTEYNRLNCNMDSKEFEVFWLYNGFLFDYVYPKMRQLEITGEPTYSSPERVQNELNFHQTEVEETLKEQMRKFNVSSWINMPESDSRDDDTDKLRAKLLTYGLLSGNIDKAISLLPSYNHELSFEFGSSPENKHRAFLHNKITKHTNTKKFEHQLYNEILKSQDQEIKGKSIEEKEEKVVEFLKNELDILTCDGILDNFLSKEDNLFAISCPDSQRNILGALALNLLYTKDHTSIYKYTCSDGTFYCYGLDEDISVEDLNKAFNENYEKAKDNPIYVLKAIKEAQADFDMGGGV